MKNIDDDMRQLLNEYGSARYNAGYLDGVWKFYNTLKDTHKTPYEIFNDLIDGISKNSDLFHK